MIYPHGINLYFPISIEKRICLIGLPEKDYLTYLNTLHAFDILEVGNTVLNCIPSHTTDDTFTDCYLVCVSMQGHPMLVSSYMSEKIQAAIFFFGYKLKRQLLVAAQYLLRCILLTIFLLHASLFIYFNRPYTRYEYTL